MAKTCDICNKGYVKANLVPTGIGKRVTRRTTKWQKPNLRSKRLEIGDQKVRIMICAGCLKRLSFDKQAQTTA